jgi:type IV pilus assembly protein PilB
MTMTSAIREMTFKGEPTQNIRRQAQMMGMKTLVGDALDKALIGVTSIAEVLMLHRGGH